MGLLSANLKAALQTRRATLFWVLELGLPGGTKRYGMGDASVIDQGHYHGKLVSVGGVSRDATDRSFGLRTLELSDDIDDVDFTFAKIVEGSSGHSIIGSTAVRKLGAEGVGYADWLTYFSGIVEQYEFPEPLRYRVRIRTDDRRLRRPFGVVITQSDWPNSSADARGQLAPHIYGTLSANGGAIPCPLVDITGCRYMVSRGRVKAVTTVYVAGAVVTTGYTVTYPVVNGRQYTLVDFTTSQGESAVSCDVQGYEAVGDGSGAVIEGPDQIKHWLSSFVYEDYLRGNWPAASAVLNTTHFSNAQAFANTARGHKGSRWIGGPQQDAGAVLNEWCESYQCRPFWTNLGKLAVRFEDHGITSTYFDSPWLRWERDDLGSWALRYDSLELLDRVNVQYLRNEVEDQYTQSLEVRDRSLTVTAAESFDVAWAHGAVS